VTLADLLAQIVGALDAAGIPHMIAGSLASTLHGEPRSTQDIDLVIDPTRDQLAVLVDGLDRHRFYVGHAFGAFERRDQFNVIDVTTGWKVDLILRQDRQAPGVYPGGQCHSSLPSKLTKWPLFTVNVVPQSVPAGAPGLNVVGGSRPPRVSPRRARRLVMTSAGVGVAGQVGATRSRSLPAFQLTSEKLV
jgi:hypothetical protein